MPVGLEVRDASGTLIIDLGTRMSRVIDIINPNYIDGSKSYPGLANTVVGVVADYFVSQGSTGGTGGVPNVTTSGTTVNWTWPIDPMFRMDVRIIVFGY